ncbi:hypothetical protein JW859_08475 [bacterium]|nr:hypothetical protein [bacterium]
MIIKRYCHWLGSIVFLLAGCVGDSVSVEQPNSLATVTAYLPYVEAVHIPSHVIANQSFEIEFELAAPLQPDSLNGYSMSPYLNIFSSVEDQAEVIDFVISTWTHMPAVPSEPNPNPSLTIVGLAAGTYSLCITTAASVEQGGVAFTVQVPDSDMDRFSPQYMPDNPAVSSIELELTVYPE